MEKNLYKYKIYNIKTKQQQIQQQKTKRKNCEKMKMKRNWALQFQRFEPSICSLPWRFFTTTLPENAIYYCQLNNISFLKLFPWNFRRQGLIEPRTV